MSDSQRQHLQRLGLHYFVQDLHQGHYGATFEQLEHMGRFIADLPEALARGDLVKTHGRRRRHDRQLLGYRPKGFIKSYPSKDVYDGKLQQQHNFRRRHKLI